MHIAPVAYPLACTRGLGLMIAMAEEAAAARGADWGVGVEVALMA
jgi:hypothetical protein